LEAKAESLHQTQGGSSARDILVVILVAADVDETEQPAREWWGANAWVASPRDRRLYAEED
jgi:hypothetical protein